MMPSWADTGRISCIEPRHPSHCISGILVGICCLVFAPLAHVQYPLAFSPTADWLNRVQHLRVLLQGVRFCPIGCVATGLPLAVRIACLS
jgi:hypothetical protein